MKRTVLFAAAILLSICFFSKSEAQAQTEDLKIKFGAYIDTYIATDNDNLSQSAYYRKFGTSNLKKDEFSLNVAQVSADLSYKTFARGTLTLHYGDLPKMASSSFAEPAIQEAHIGFRMIDKLWIDAGYFTTHLGNESLLPKDNWLTSHSMVTFYEPFFQSGMRIGWEDEQFTGRLYVLNGSGIIQENNDNKTIGLYVNYSPSNQLSFTYANTIGNEEPRKQKGKTMFFNTFSVNASVTPQFGIKGQIDYATLADGAFEDGKVKDATLLGLSVAGRYQVTNKIAGTLRASYVDNSDGGFGAALSGLGLTLGGEYRYVPNSFIRLETRLINLDDKYKMFYDGKEHKNSRLEVALNMGFYIN